LNDAELRWYCLRWPREVSFDRLRAMSLLLASTRRPAVVEAIGRGGLVEHRIAVGLEQAANLIEQLRVILPGLSVTPLARRPVFGATLALEIRLSSALTPIRDEQPEVLSKALLVALAQARTDEATLLQFHLLRTYAPASVRKTERVSVSASELLPAVMGRQRTHDSESLRALRAKRALPTWRCVGRVGVRVGSPARARALLHQLVQSLAVADAPGVRLVARRTSPSRIDLTTRPWIAPLRLNSSEVALLSAWPVGTTSELPVERSPQSLPPSSAIPRGGRILGTATFAGRERPLGLSPTDGLGHVHVLGPTGTGKSTLLLNLITQDIEAGRAVVVIEPKGDLVRSVLERVPSKRIDDVIYLDPSDGDDPIGLNPLATRGRPPELVADELLGMFRAMYESSWGPRTNDILAASLLTLARVPGMTLCALPALLTNPAFRHRIVSQIHDPVGLAPFWSGFEAWSDAERAAAIAPSLNRVRPFLLRPQLRRVLGQASPRFDLKRVFADRKVLLVNLAKGPLGAEAAALLGGFVLSQLWAAALRRSTVPPEKRPPAFVYVDEVQDYLRLPTDLGDALVQARGLGVGFVLAHQHLGQLDARVRAAALANARSRVCFQLAGDDARTLASGAVSAEDLRELAPFEAYAQLFVGGAVRPWCSLRTLPPSRKSIDPHLVLGRSREQFGVSGAMVDAGIEQLLAGGRVAASDVAPRRRVDRGTS